MKDCLVIIIIILILHKTIIKCTVMPKTLKQFYIRKDQVTDLENYSTKDVSQAEIVRRALDKYFKHIQNSN